MSEPTLPPVAALAGTASDRGAVLREAFSRSAARNPAPAQLAVSAGGESLVDLAHGIEPDRPVQVFSVSQSLVAVAAALAHDRGELDLDAPLASYWPAFDRAATRGITAMHVLDHSSGISAIQSPLSAEQLVAGALDEAVERQDPLWEPGSAHAYGAFTFGALMSGVFRHGLGTPVQEYVAREIVAPAGASFSFGADAALRERLAPLTFRPPVLTEAQAQELMSGTALQDGSMLPIMMDGPGFFTNPEVLACDWPAMSGVTAARDLVAVFEAVMGYGRDRALLSPAALARLTAERHSGPDRGIPFVSRYGAGVELPHGLSPLLGPGSFGHQGAGGSVVAVDPATGTVFAYVSTLMDATVGISDQALVLLGAAAAEARR
jgi:CubicO group peptidase (beta-lactamase class C family)